MNAARIKPTWRQVTYYKPWRWGGLARACMRIGFLLTVMAPLVAAYPFIVQQFNQARASSVADTVIAMNTPPHAINRQRVKDAEAYNRRLLTKPGLIGEAVDPFGNPHGDFSGRDDPEYMKLLDDGGGLMSVVEIPQISVKLPIYHGSSPEVLSMGAGHLHGTSLPVGGKGTHTVITAHRGMNDKLMFTRLDELKPGSIITLQTEGKLLTYQVDRVNTVEPTDTKLLRIKPDEDRLTLLTCTPIGINTMRLLVSGVRIPNQSVTRRATDPKPLMVALLFALILLLIISIIYFTRPTPRMPRHTSFGATNERLLLHKLRRLR